MHRKCNAVFWRWWCLGTWKSPLISFFKFSCYRNVWKVRNDLKLHSRGAFLECDALIFVMVFSYIDSELFTASLTIVYRETENQVCSLLSAVATQWFEKPVRGVWGGTWKQISETSVKNVYLYINNLSNSFLSVSVFSVFKAAHFHFIQPKKCRKISNELLVMFNIAVNRHYALQIHCMFDAWQN